MALPFIKLGLAAAAGYYFFNRFRKSRGAGSTTNASDAVDDVRLGPKPRVEEKLDEGRPGDLPGERPGEHRPPLRDGLRAQAARAVLKKPLQPSAFSAGITSRAKSSMFLRVRSAGSVPNWHITSRLPKRISCQ